MMTPQEAASSTFPKATLGGYNMAAVDVFLDKLTEDYATLYKENAALKAKINVLVKKMESYHTMEDTMRSTLLTAQKVANDLVAEAEQKSAKVLAQGEAAAKDRFLALEQQLRQEQQRLEDTRQETDRLVEQEQERLVVAKRELNAFVDAARKLCQRQMEMIERLPELEILPQGMTISPAEEQPAAEIPVPESIPAADLTGEELGDDAVAAAAVAEATEELGGDDAATLLHSMQEIINAVANKEEIPETAAEDETLAQEEAPAFPSLQDTLAPILFPAEEPQFDEDDYEAEDMAATKPLDKDLLRSQFGPDYKKDR